MPIHLSPVSRREFLRSALVAAAGITIIPCGCTDTATGDTHWALLSDVHVAADPDAILHEVNMAAHLRQALAEVLALERKPAGVFINGDCACTAGLPDDYATLRGLLRPVAVAKLPLHMTLGNHDHRENIRAAFAKEYDKVSPVESRHVSIVETSLLDWVLLDSLDKVNSTPGVLGKTQLDWLAAALDSRKDKPVIVMVHHNPQTVAAGNTTTKVSGLTDTAELFDVILPRKNVKALVFGHSHRWDLKQRDGLHLVNLPAVAYVFAKDQASAWVDCNLAADGMTLEFRSLNPAHPAHGQKTGLKWRA